MLVIYFHRYIAGAIVLKVYNLPDIIVTVDNNGF
jgi:hypothetical protein